MAAALQFALLSVSLARSSGFAELDNEVLALVRRASPVPAPRQASTKPSQPPSDSVCGDKAKQDARVARRLGSDRMAISETAARRG
jgi:hypothetical protein